MFRKNAQTLENDEREIETKRKGRVEIPAVLIKNKKEYSHYFVSIFLFEQTIFTWNHLF